MTAYDVLRSTRGPCVLFESTSTGPLARRHIVARHPRAAVVATRDGIRRVDGSGARPWPGDAVDALRSLLAEVRPGRWPDEGGIAGVLAYDFARPRREPAPTPWLLAFAVDRFVVYEDGAPVAGGGPAPAHLERLEEALGLSLPAAGPAGGSNPTPPLDLAAWSSLSREDHRRLVRRAQSHIAAGDIYQANLSQRFRLPWTLGGMRLYHHLRRLSPAPFSGYLRAGGLEVVSASPERLVLVEGGRLSTRPIAGTRPRSTDPLRDRALAEELILSEKERAEHLMLVDLARNDLGRVAEMGSVTVNEMMAVEEYAHVRHIVSNVTARLARGRGPFDALAALFPGGTITGVPKIRCMEILDELEPVPRGFYTGALFYATPSGRLDANILIRSAVVHGGCVTFHTGGGIVADSEPELEYAETLHKAEGLRLAVEAALGDADR